MQGRKILTVTAALLSGMTLCYAAPAWAQESVSVYGRAINARTELVRFADLDLSATSDQTRLHLTFKQHNLVTVTDPHTGFRGGETIKIQPDKPLFFDAAGMRIA